MNTGGGVPLPDQEILQRIGALLGLHEHQGEGVWPSGGVQEIQQERALLHLLHPHNLLGDVLAGAAHTTHGQEDVVVQEISSKHLKIRNQRVLSTWHVFMNSTYMYQWVTIFSDMIYHLNQ